MFLARHRQIDDNCLFCTNHGLPQALESKILPCIIYCQQVSRKFDLGIRKILVKAIWNLENKVNSRDPIELSTWKCKQCDLGFQLLFRVVHVRRWQG